MALPSDLQSPISILNRDLLWNIFNTSTSNTAWYPQDESNRSPLTITRRCSQVCSFWREIILESSSIWGKCIDLNLLAQERGEWRDEVLQRTGNAPLSVRSHYDKAIAPHTGVHTFLLDLIDHHWARIRIFDVYVKSDQTLNDARVWSAFSHPAPSLREFSVFSVDIFPRENVHSTMTFPGDIRLFADDAPVLTQFSLHNPTRIIIPFGVRPFPPIFLTNQFRNLSLLQPMQITASDLLIACEQMPGLEALTVSIARSIPDNISNTPPYPHRKVSLPRLRAIAITTPNLDIYPAFLDRIVACPGCSLSIETTLGGIQTVTASVEAMLRVYSQFSNSLFDYYRHGPNPVTDLSLTMLSGSLILTTYHHSYYLRLITPAEDEGMPDHILNSVLDIISALRFPKTIIKFTFSLISGHPLDPLINTTLSKLFLALGSVAELSTIPTSLSYISRLSKSQTSILFPMLKTIFLRGLDGFPNKVEYIKPFFADRQHIASIEVLNLTRSHWPFGDLRFLDELTGLKVVWKQDNVITEYICGSGNREMLSLGSDDVPDWDDESD